MDFKWEKLGLCFDPTKVKDRPFLKQFSQAPCSLVFDDFVRVYFSCRPEPETSGQYVSYSAFVDLDRKDLFNVLRLSKKPILDLGGIGTFDEFGTYPVSVVQFENKFRAYYAGWTRCESVPFNVAIGVAESLDGGVTFAKLGDGPILSYTPDEPFILSGPKIRYFNNQWYLFYIAGKKWKLDMGKPEPVYRIRMANSSDGIHWIKQEKDLINVKLEDDEAQASPDVFWYQNKYHMLFCYRYSTDYRNKERGYRIGYASSVDLVNWDRDDPKAGIDVSEHGWDSEMISYPHVLQLDGNFYMFYLGNQVGKNGFGLAILKK